jgi:hypothetical protein
VSNVVCNIDSSCNVVDVHVPFYYTHRYEVSVSRIMD